METEKILKQLSQSIMTMIFIVAVCCCSGCVTFIGYDGPYEGRIIDRDTHKPIEGAVVHGTWVRSSPGPGGATGRYYDSQEVLTDKDGNFKISGMGQLILSNIEEMEVNIFKAGYGQLCYAYWSSLKDYETKDAISTLDGNKAIIKLRRKTMVERRMGGPSQPNGPGKKQRLWRVEHNKEMIETNRPNDTLLTVE